MGRRRRPHDEFFKKLMEQPGAAEALLRERLPPAVLACLAPGPPQEVPGSFIDAGLRATQGDKLFRLRTRWGGDAWVYCLVEHKSVPDRRIALQLLRYLARVWEHLAREHPGQLPLVVPLVVYHGRTRWPVATRFSALLEDEAAVVPGALDFEYAVLDVGSCDEDELSALPVLRGGLLGLKYAQRPEEQVPNLARVTRLMVGPDGLPLDEFIAYVVRAYLAVDVDALVAALQDAVPGKDEEMISIAARQWLAEGRQEGRQVGRQEGRQEGEVQNARAMLRVVLRRRFHEVPARVEALIASAEVATLTGWLEAAVDAPSLDHVFPGQEH